MALSPTDLRKRIQDAVAAAADWSLSAHPYTDFPPSKDSAAVMHKSFSVGLTSTTASADHRQRPGVGAVCVTGVGVRFLSMIRADDKNTSIDDALANEAALVALVLSTSEDPELSLRFVGVPTRAQISDTTFHGEVSFEVLHHYPLS